MIRKTLDIKQLNEKEFSYLQELFDDPAYEGEDFDSFYAYLSYLDECEIIIDNYTFMSDFSACIISRSALRYPSGFGAPKFRPVRSFAVCPFSMAITVTALPCISVEK